MREDQFVTTVFRTREWVQSNLNVVLIAIGAVVVIVAAIWYFTAGAERRQQEARELLARAEMEARANQLQDAIVALEKLLDDYGSSAAANLGALKLANVYFAQNQFEKAEEMFKTYLDDYLIDEISRYSALEGIAAAQSAQGKFQEAGENYLEVARLNPSAVTYEDNLLSAVENLIKAGDEQGAREAFSLLAEEGETSENYRTAKILMIENGFLTYDEGDFE
jgi:predicted negative regulator of RcsB-dependent stress response